MSEKKSFTKEEVRTYKKMFEENCTPGIDHIKDTVKFKDMQKLIKGAGIHGNSMNHILTKVGAKNDEYTEIQFFYFC